VTGGRPPRGERRLKSQAKKDGELQGRKEPQSGTRAADPDEVVAVRAYYAFAARKMPMCHILWSSKKMLHMDLLQV
jgi:hypothetical protein